MYLQHCVIRRDPFKSDVRMPANTGEAASVGKLMGQPPTLFLLLTADDANLVAKLTAFFSQRVNVKAG